MKTISHLQRTFLTTLLIVILTACNSSAAPLTVSPPIITLVPTITAEQATPTPTPTATEAANGQLLAATEGGMRVSADGGVLAWFDPDSRTWETVQAAVEVNAGDKLAKFPAIYNPLEVSPPLTRPAAELALLQAEQYLRLYRQEMGLFGQEKQWPSQQAFIDEMQAFAMRHPEWQVMQRQSPDGASVITVIYNPQTNQILWGANPDGTLASHEPHFYRGDTTLVWVNLPAGTTPEWRYHAFNSRWFLFALDATGVPQFWLDAYRATIADVNERWQPLFHGTFSEKYSPSFTDEYVYHDPDSDLNIPVGIALTNDLPVTAIYLTDMGKEQLAEAWLAACYIRYTDIMKHPDVTMAQYLALVKEGKGQVLMWYFDELSGRAKLGLVDPRNGVSITVTGRSDLPLDKMLPRVSDYPQHYYISVNSQGRPVLAIEWNLEALRDSYNRVVIERKSQKPGYYYSSKTYSRFGGIIFIWAMLTLPDFEQGGVMQETNHPVWEELIEGPNRQVFAGIDYETATSTPWASVDYRK